jgi:hypothetical protein
MPNSRSWKHIFEKWSKFAIKAWNIILRLALNGVNPFGYLNSCHFTWLVILLNYNLPLWFITNQYFLMLALIIHGKKSITIANVDVYLEPFIEALQLSWQGVKTFDSFQGATFNLRAMCIWNIHDFLAYGLFAGCVTKGLVGCPTCGPTTKSQYSKKSFIVGIDGICHKPIHISKLEVLSMGKQKTRWCLCK